MERNNNSLRWQALVLSNVIVASYNLAVIWLVQLDVFYTWRYIPTEVFGQVQGEHFWRLFIIVFPQAIAAFVIAVWLLRVRPESISAARRGCLDAPTCR